MVYFQSENSSKSEFETFVEKMTKEYPGYPEYVVITLPKQGTKTINKCCSSLGYKGEFISIIFGCKPKSAVWLAYRLLA